MADVASPHTPVKEESAVHEGSEAGMSLGKLWHEESAVDITAQAATPDEVVKSCESIGLQDGCDRDPFGDRDSINVFAGSDAGGGDVSGVVPSGIATRSEATGAEIADAEILVDGLIPMGPALHLTMSDAPRCRLCLGPVDPLDKGVKNFKRDDSYQCKTCCCKWTGLVREFGEWPTTDFDACTQAEQTEFWQKTPPGIKALRQSVVNLLVKRRVETLRNKRGGAFLPLEVLGRLGHDK